MVIFYRIDVIIPYKTWVYYSNLIQESVVFALYVYSLGVKIYQGKPTFLLLFIVILMGVAWAGLALWRVQCLRLSLLQKNGIKIKSYKVAENYVQVASSLCFIGQGSTELRYFKYYHSLLHSQSCKNSNCVCRTRHEEKEAVGQWLLLFEQLLDQIAEKFPNSHRIILQQSYYQCHIIKNYFKSYYWLNSASNLQSQIYEKFLLFRMKHIIAQAILTKESKNMETTSFISVLKFQKMCILFHDLLKYTTELAISFWSLLEQSRINVKEVYVKGKKITVSLKWINELFKIATDLNSEYPFLYISYGQFLQMVLNSEDEGREWLNKGNDILKQQSDNRIKYHKNISKSPDAAVIVISGNLNSIGVVKNANQHVESQLGYVVSELKGRNISRIMPHSIGEIHDSFIEHHFKTGRGKLLDSENILFMQTKSGLLEPIIVYIKTFPNLQLGIEYIGFLKKDISKIKLNNLNIPSQYKLCKTAYILTNEELNIEGLSKNACALFGLPTAYISRNTKITTQPFSITKLYPSLGTPEFQHNLKIGTEIIITPKSILQYLDFDFLTKEEQQQVLETSELPRKVFIMVKNVNSDKIVNLKIFIIIDLKGNSVILDRLLRKENTTSFENSQNIVQDSTMSIGSCSSGIGRIPSQNSISNFKKQTNIRDRPDSIKKLVYAISILSCMIIAGIATDFTLNTIYSQKVNTFHEVIVLLHKRLSHFNISIYMTFLYLSFANAPVTYFSLLGGSDYFTNRTKSYLQTFKDNEYEFEEISKTSSMTSIRESLVYKKLNISTIYKDFSIKTSQVVLHIALMKIIAQATAVVNFSPADAISTYFKNNFVPLSSSDTIDENSRKIYFVIINAISSLHEALSQTSDILYDKCNDELDEQKKYVVIVNICIFILMGICLIGIIPISSSIQSSKRKILIIFSQISLKLIKEVSERAKQYLLSHFQQFKKTTIDLKSAGGSNTTLPVNNSDSVKLKTKELLEVKKKLAIQQNNQPSHSDEIKEEEKLMQEENEILLPEGAEKEKRKELTSERKKTLSKTSLTISKVTIITTISFLCIMAYWSKIFYFTYSNISDTKTMVKGTGVIQRRLIYISNCFFFFGVFLKSLEDYQYSINGVDPFTYYMEQSLKIEKEFSNLAMAPPYGLEKLFGRLANYDETGFCDKYAVSLGITVSYCKRLNNGTCNEGLSRSISYFLTRTRNAKLGIDYSSSVASAKYYYYSSMELTYFALMFINLYNPLFEELFAYCSEVFSSQKNTDFFYKLLEFIVFLFLFLISYVIMTKYFVKNLEEQIFMARGIVTLLPEKMLKKKKINNILLEASKAE